jgi:hypothetical protein
MMTIRRLCVPWLVLLSGVLIGACGGSSHRGGGNGVASKPAKAILASAFAAVAHSTSMHMSGVVPAGKQEGTEDVDIATGRGIKASVVVNGLRVRLITLGARSYLKGSPAFYTHFAGPGAATLIKNRWLEVPTSDMQAFAKLINPQQLFGYLRQLGGANMIKTRLNTIDGKKVIGLTDDSGDELYVAAVGKPFPIVLEVSESARTFRVTFSDYNRPLSIVAPREAVKISSLEGRS